MTKSLLKKLLLSGLLAGNLVTCDLALAQRTGPNGGMIMGADGHEAELVITPNVITVYLMDHGKIADVRKAAIKAVIQDGGKTKTINLTPSPQDNSLFGQLEAPLSRGAKIVVSGKMADGDVVQARFVAP